MDACWYYVMHLGKLHSFEEKEGIGVSPDNFVGKNVCIFSNFQVVVSIQE